MVTGIRITKWQTRDPERLAWQLSEFERRLLKISSSGSTEECCDVTDFLIQIPGIAARGDILFYGAAGWELLPAGTSGHFLQTSGAGADPVWAAGGGGGGFANTVVSQAPAANQQDWTITGRTSYTTVLTTNTTNSFLGGVTGGSSGDVLHVVNGSGDTMLWLVHEDPGSTAANRFNLQRGSAFVPPGETATFVYNATASRWALLSMSINMMDVTEKTQMFVPNTGTTVTTIGIGASSSTATLSTITPTATPTNDFTEDSATQVTNSAASGSSDVRATIAKFMRGATTGRQGIFFNARVRFTALGATGGVAVGLTSSTAAITTQPSANTNVIYIGADGGQTTLRAICRDGAAGTPVDLGANFPVPNATAAYEVCFFCPSNVAKVNYMVRRLDTDFKTEGTFTTNLPSNTLLMGHRINVMVGATATASTAQFTRLLTRHVS